MPSSCPRQANVVVMPPLPRRTPPHRRRARRAAPKLSVGLRSVRGRGRSGRSQAVTMHAGLRYAQLPAAAFLATARVNPTEGGGGSATGSARATVRATRLPVLSLSDFWVVLRPHGKSSSQGSSNSGGGIMGGEAMQRRRRSVQLIAVVSSPGSTYLASSIACSSTIWKLFGRDDNEIAFGISN
ncbi:hypothetical protein ABZP36_008025 [Zizania latifolia]